jgi:DNA-binding transcriptional LysR family regulator
LRSAGTATSVALRNHSSRRPPRRGVLVCRADHPLLRLLNVSQEDLESYPLVGISMTREVRGRIGAAASFGDVDRLTGDVTPVIATYSVCAMREILRRNNGVGICPPSRVRDDVRAARRLPSSQTGSSVHGLLRGLDGIDRRLS